jgi:hypothetical protein
MKELNYVNRKELLDLFNSIGSLWNFDKDKQNELTKKMSAKIIDYLHNHKAENSSVEFSLRQKTVIEVAQDCINDGALYEAYWQISDIVENYGDMREGKLFVNESLIILELLSKICE